jgi:chemotaxis protein histidine kinase CheA
MDANVLSHIFEPFFTTKKNGKGTGLGLPRVKECIESYKGHIHVLSELGKGTSIEICLPLVKTILFPASEKVPTSPEAEAVGIVAEVITCKKTTAEPIKTILKED